MPSHNPSIREIGFEYPYLSAQAVQSHPILQDLGAEILYEQFPYRVALESDLAMAKALGENPNENFNLSPLHDTYNDKLIQLAELEMLHEYPEAETFLEYSLRDFVQERIDTYNRQRKQFLKGPKRFVATNEFVAGFALRSAERHRQAIKQVASTEIYKRITSQNIKLLQGLIAPADQELYANVNVPEHTAVDDFEEDGLMHDPEAIELSQRVGQLEATYQKRWAIRQLARAFGHEVSADFSRPDVEAISALVDEYGQSLTA